MNQFVIGFILATNLVAFFAFGVDKRRARLNRRRVSEAALLWFSLPLAAPGGWIGMSVFRHKTQKSSFRMKMVLVTLVNAVLLWGLLQVWPR